MISVAEARRLVELTEQSDDRARAAEHLVRAWQALAPRTSNPVIAREQVECAIRVLLQMEPQT